MRTVGLKVNAPIGPHGRREGMVEGLEERSGILRTRIPLQREVFFFSCPVNTVYGMFCFNLKPKNFKADTDLL